MRARLVARRTAASAGFVLAASLLLPGLVAAATPTYGFTQSSPTPGSVNYSDLVTFRGAYTCLNGPDASSYCPTTSMTQTATFAIRPSGGSTFTTAASVTTTFAFASTSSGCPTTCSRAFQVQWKSGRAGSATVPPGTYDVRLTTTLTADEVVLLNAVVITQEGTTTAYTGLASGDEGTALALKATVADVDHGVLSGSGVWLPDTNFGASTSFSFWLYDASNTTLVVGPVSASVSASGTVVGSVSLTLPSAGTYVLRTEYGGNAFYAASADADTITSNPVNSPPSLTVPGPLTVEATSPAGAVVTYDVSATDAEDDPAPTPTCDQPSGSTFPLGTTTVHCSVTDSGGLGDSGAFDVTVVDTTSPMVAVDTAEDVGASGWYNAASNDGRAGLTVDVTATDLVGVTSVSCTDNGVPVDGLGSSGGSFVVGDGSHVVACSAADGANNTDDDGASFDVDQTSPAGVAFEGGGLVEGGWYPFGAVPDGPTGCTADDAVSGVASCDVAGYSTEAGTWTITATATDHAGNVATAELHYGVGTWTLVGFAKPIDMTGENLVKAGHQAQLRFEAWAGTTQLVSTDVVAGVTQTQLSCQSWAAIAGPVDATFDLGTAGSRLVVGWLAPGQPATCWLVRVTTLDGSSLAATFRLR